jgi:hypothetical protein
LMTGSPDGFVETRPSQARNRTVVRRVQQDASGVKRRIHAAESRASPGAEKLVAAGEKSLPCEEHAQNGESDEKPHGGTSVPMDD